MQMCETTQLGIPPYLIIILQLLQQVLFEVLQLCHLPVEPLHCLNQRVLLSNQLVLLCQALPRLRGENTRGG
jgi:hypothetical protein